MASAVEQRAALREALVRQTHVRIERRPKGADRIDGFVVALGTKWALLQATRDGGYFDGYIAFRVAGVKRIRTARSFEGAFARTLTEWPPTSPDGIDLAGTKRVVRSLAGQAPILGVEQEGWWPGRQWIGAVVGFRAGLLGLRQVKPDATWRKRATAFKLNRITKIEVARGYHVALARTAGDPPASAV